MSENTEPKSIALTWELPHPPTKVWRALTDPKLLARWLMDNDLRPTVGHRFTFRQEPTPWWDGIVQCEVQELELHKRIRYSWSSGGKAPLNTVVTWTLTETASGTRLALDHTGFVSTNAFAFQGAQTGWQRMVDERLREVLGRGETS